MNVLLTNDFGFILAVMEIPYKQGKFFTIVKNSIYQHFMYAFNLQSARKY